MVDCPLFASASAGVRTPYRASAAIGGARTRRPSTAPDETRGSQSCLVRAEAGLKANEPLLTAL